jgi:hypothetical protein
VSATREAIEDLERSLATDLERAGLGDDRAWDAEALRRDYGGTAAQRMS